MAMIRKLFTMSDEHERKLAILAGKNASGFLQRVIDKLFEAKERQDAIESATQQSVHSIGNE